MDTSETFWVFINLSIVGIGVIIVVYLLYEFSFWVCRVQTLDIKSRNELPRFDGILFVLATFLNVFSVCLVLKLRPVEESRKLDDDKQCGQNGEAEWSAPSAARGVSNFSFVA